MMKYTVSTIIDKPIEQVLSLFKDTSNYKEWMEGLQSYEHLSGTPGEPDAKSRLKFKLGKRDMEMVETIKTNNLPKEYTVTYDTKGVFNIVTNRFNKVSDNKTKYVTEQYFKFGGFMKIIAFLMSGAFKKQSMKYLNDFKSFIERQN